MENDAVIKPRILGIIWVHPSDISPMTIIAQHPMLYHVYHRCFYSLWVTDWIISLPADKEYDAVEEECKKWQALVYRGDNLISGYEKTHGPIDYMVPVNANCPLIDPIVMDNLIEKVYLSQKTHMPAEYGKTVGFPQGLGVEVWASNVLCGMNPANQVELPNIIDSGKLSKSHWKVDTIADLTFMRCIYHYLYHPVKGRVFLMEEVLNLLERIPNIGELNAR
jgi:spore coat polysaccharide biosynthesis protein SpsF (cytidylyltransferase family)